MSLLDGKELKATEHPEIIFCVKTEEQLKTSGVDFLGWYFWDETYDHAHGPFNTYEETVTSLNVYAEGYL